MTTETATPLLTATNVSVRLGGAAVVDGAGFSLRAGELVALVGPNGAGKTTLLRAVAGLLPASGVVAIGAKRLDALPIRERARTIAYLPQGHIFHWPMSVASVVALGRHPYADAYSSPSAADRAAVERALAATSIEEFRQRLITQLSGGERARVALARALATEAPVLLADEPTASLDPRHQLLIMDLLQRAARNGGAVLAILHDLALAARFADRVIVMNAGRIVVDGPPAEALNTQRIAEIFQVQAVTVDSGAGSIPVAVRPL